MSALTETKNFAYIEQIAKSLRTNPQKWFESDRKFAISELTAKSGLPSNMPWFIELCKYLVKSLNKIQQILLGQTKQYKQQQGQRLLQRHWLYMTAHFCLTNHLGMLICSTDSGCPVQV